MFFVCFIDSLNAKLSIICCIDFSHIIAEANNNVSLFKTFTFQLFFKVERREAFEVKSQVS